MQIRGIARAAFTAVIIGSLSAGPISQELPRQPERGADMLSIQFSVVASDGTPITDLKPAEVSIRLGGRARPVRSLQAISIASDGEADTSGLPLPFGTNAVSAAGRSVAIVFDEESFRPGQEPPLREGIGDLLSRLGPGDRVSLLGVPFAGVKVPFTTDHSRIRTVLPVLVGHAPATESGSDLACRTRRTLEALVTYLEGLGIREEPITTIFVTAAMAAPRRDAAFGLPPGMCELSEHLFTRVGLAAGAARAQFYVVRPGDASNRALAAQRETTAGSDHPLAGIEHLAGVTGGKLLALTSTSGSAFDRIVRETTVHYLASVDSGANDRTGRSQQLSVDVSRRGAEVRSQPHVTFGKPEPATSRLLQPSLRDMLGSSVLFRDLPLRALAFPALTADDGAVRVVAVAEAVDPSAKIETLGAVLFDRDGKVAAQWLATPEELQRSPVMGAMSVPTGAYRLRVAAIDTTGRSGTVDYDVEADIVSTGALKLSSLVLGVNRPGGFAPRLQFTDEPLAVAYVELEGAPAGARVAAALEIAQSLNGPAIVTVPLTIDGAGGGRYTAMGSLAVGALPPGDYVARAMIGLEGQPMTRVVRTIRKVK